MRKLTSCLVVGLCAVLFGFVFTADANGQGTPEKSFFTVTEPLDVGGTILQPGEYQIKVIPLLGNRNLLQIKSADASTLFATLLSVPHTEVPGAVRVSASRYVYYPASAGKVKTLRTWYAADTPSTGGHDIVYPRQRALELAALVNEPVVAVEDTVKEAEYEAAPLYVVTPAKEVKPYPVVVAQAPVDPPTATVQEATYRQKRLPQTASNVPLYAGFGLLSLLGALVLGVLARRVA